MSKYKGVSWIKREQKWRASICHNGKSYSLGNHDDEKEAALAYYRKARQLLLDEYHSLFKEIRIEQEQRK